MENVGFFAQMPIIKYQKVHKILKEKKENEEKEELKIKWQMEL